MSWLTSPYNYNVIQFWISFEITDIWFTNSSCFFMISSYNFSCTSGFLASRKAVLVRVVAVVSNPASRNTTDYNIYFGKLFNAEKRINQIDTWAITISSTSSLSHIGTTLPSTTLVCSKIVSVATSTKSWYFYIAYKIILSLEYKPSLILYFTLPQWNWLAV